MSYLAGKPVTGIVTSYTTSSDIVPTGTAASQSGTFGSDWNIPLTADVTNASSGITIDGNGDLSCSAGDYWIRANIGIKISNNYYKDRDSWSVINPSYLYRGKQSYIRINWFDITGTESALGLPFRLGEKQVTGSGNGNHDNYTNNANNHYNATLMTALTSTTTLSLRACGVSIPKRFSNATYKNYDYGTGVTLYSDSFYVVIIEIPT